MSSHDNERASALISLPLLLIPSREPTLIMSSKLNCFPKVALLNIIILGKWLGLQHLNFEGIQNSVLSMFLGLQTSFKSCKHLSLKPFFASSNTIDHSHFAPPMKSLHPSPYMIVTDSLNIYCDHLVQNTLAFYILVFTGPSTRIAHSG